MFPAAVRTVLLAALVSAASAAAPPLPATRFGGGTYVSVIDMAERLGLRLSWSDRGRHLILSDPQHRIELAAESRETLLDGLKVFLGDPVVARGGRFYVSRTDFERCLIPRLRPAAGGPPPSAPRLIVLDPGHGGEDHGTENRRLGLMEKTFTLDVALRLRKLLEAAGYRVLLTRDSDVDVPKPWRAEIANRAGADLFISIHFNSVAPDTKTRGSEIFTFVPQFQRATDSSDREKEASPANRRDHWNAVLAHAMYRELMRILKTDDHGEKIAHWAVLRPLNCPGVLVESAFLSNDAEASRVATPAFRQTIAEAMLAGVRAYSATLGALRAPPSPPAPQR